MPAIATTILAGALALASPPDGDVSVDGFGQAVPGQALADMRGGDSNSSTTTVTSDNQGEVGGNTAAGNAAGGNVVTGGAFGNAAGINTVIQNSGANVLIQNGTAVNVGFGGPTP